MPEAITNIATNPSVRRWAIAALTMAIASLNKKFDLKMEPADIIAILGVGVAYLIQSAAVDRARILAAAQKTGTEAAAAVVTLDDAAKVLASKPTPPMAGTP